MALLSSVKIANLALSKVGESGTIESFGEDSASAQVADLWFDFARQETLSSFNWSFARKRLTLASHSEDPPDTWGYRYQYPAACLKARFIQSPAGDDGDPIAFEVELSSDETKSILTDEDDAVLIYTADITTPHLFSHYFVEAFATVLAWRMSFALTGKFGVRDRLAEEALRLMRLAPAMDASEKQESPERDAKHIRMRD